MQQQCGTQQQPDSLQKLESESKSEFSEKAREAFQESSYQRQTSNDQILTKQELHNLILTEQKSIQMKSKQVDKYVARIIFLNNDAYSKMQKLQISKQTKKDLAEQQHSHNNHQANQIKQQTINRLNDPVQCEAGQNKQADEQIYKIQKQIKLSLKEAEQILQYAANCGKIIDRNLILSVLCNQASYYQRMWRLSESCLYLQAIIINMQQWGEESQWSQCSNTLSVASKSSQNLYQFNFLTNNGHYNFEDDIILMNMRKWKPPKSDYEPETYRSMPFQDTHKLAQNYELEDNQVRSICSNEISNLIPDKYFAEEEVIRRHIVRLFQLSIFYLQYCSLCGQMGAHKQAIQTANKLIKKIRKMAVLNHKYFAQQQYKNNIKISAYKFPLISNNKEYQSSATFTNRKIVLGLNYLLNKFSQHEGTQIENYRQVAKHYLKVRCQHNKYCLKSKSVIQCEKYNNYYPNQEISQLVKQLKNYVISDILKIRSRKYVLRQTHNQQQTKPRSLLFEFSNETNNFSYPFLFSIVLLTATAYFVMATEMRLQAVSFEIQQGDRFHNQSYKKSEIYHLIAILILTIYVPVQMDFLKHLIASYENYYVHQLEPIDSMKSNEYENGPSELSQNFIINYEQIILSKIFDKYHIFPKYFNPSKCREMKEPKNQRNYRAQSHNMQLFEDSISHNSSKIQQKQINKQKIRDAFSNNLKSIKSQNNNAQKSKSKSKKYLGPIKHSKTSLQKNCQKMHKKSRRSLNKKGSKKPKQKDLHSRQNYPSYTYKDREILSQQKSNQSQIYQLPSSSLIMQKKNQIEQKAEKANKNKQITKKDRTPSRKINSSGRLYYISKSTTMVNKNVGKNTHSQLLNTFKIISKEKNKKKHDSKATKTIQSNNHLEKYKMKVRKYKSEQLCYKAPTQLANYQKRGNHKKFHIKGIKNSYNHNSENTQTHTKYKNNELQNIKRYRSNEYEISAFDNQQKLINNGNVPNNRKMNAQKDKNKRVPRSASKKNSICSIQKLESITNLTNPTDIKVSQNQISVKNNYSSNIVFTQPSTAIHSHNNNNNTFVKNDSCVIRNKQRTFENFSEKNRHRKKN